MKQKAISENMMHNEELRQKKEWVQCWQRAGVELERIRRAELPLVSTTQALENLSGAFEFARCHFTLKPYSRLIEQQALFTKYREKEMEGQLDWDDIVEQLTPLAMLKEQPQILENLKRMKSKYA